jgi:hypothetical protein
MATNKKASKKANSSKKSTKTTSRKAATEEQVVETVECVDLTMFTKEREIRTGEGRKGRLRKLGKYDYRFDEDGTPGAERRVWECHETVSQSGKVRISINANGVFLSGYWKKNEFTKTPLLAERIVDDTQEACAEIRTMDLKKRMNNLAKLKPEGV